MYYYLLFSVAVAIVGWLLFYEQSRGWRRVEMKDEGSDVVVEEVFIVLTRLTHSDKRSEPEP